MYNNIFDSHSHYDDEQFNTDIDELLLSLNEKGVTNIISCGCDIESTKKNKELSSKYPFFYYSAGFHPENLEGFSIDDIKKLTNYTNDKKCVAIGEIGLDYHWMDSTKEKQIEFFEKQIELAKELEMPIIVHDREAHGDTLEILKKYRPKGVLHCFSGSREMAQEIIKIGMYIGLNGVVTFKNARKSLEVARDIPKNKLLLETDCPYLAPEPFRGKRNDSSLIPYIAKKLSEITNTTAQKLLNQTSQNAKDLFNIK